MLIFSLPWDDSHVWTYNLVKPHIAKSFLPFCKQQVLASYMRVTFSYLCLYTVSNG